MGTELAHNQVTTLYLELYFLSFLTQSQSKCIKPMVPPYIGDNEWVTLGSLSKGVMF